MNRFTMVLVRSVTVVALALSVGPAVGAPGEVSRTLDSPSKYPAGLAADGRHLYVADWREAVIHQIDPADGRLVRSFKAPTLKPAGLACADGRLFVSDDHTGYVYSFNPNNGTVENTFEAPAPSAAGLAFADGVLFILAGDKVYKVMPEDGTILSYFAVPEKSCRQLAHDGRYLWVSDRVKDELYMVDPERGKVIGILQAPGPYPTGVAWMDGQLWNVDFQTRKLYQIVTSNEPKYRLSDTRRARVEYYWALNNYGPGEVTDLVVNLAVPMALPNQTLLTEPEYSRPPSSLPVDHWDQQCAVFDMGRVAAGSKAELTYSVQAEVSAIRWLIIPEDVGSLDDIPPDLRSKYTADSPRYRLDSPFIQETVKKTVGDERNPYWIARRIYDYIIDSLKYEMVGGWDVPEVVLKRGSGSCSEYTYSFVALCRAAGLPARYQGSVVVRGDDASIDEAFHRWAQVYLPNYGWVPVDANRGDAESPADQARGFGELSNRFLITTQGGGDSEYLGCGYNAFARHRATGYCKVEEEQFGFWEPLEPAESARPEPGAEPGQCVPLAEPRP